MARPSKLTPKVQRRLVEAVRAGNYREAACAYAGITYQTFLNWLERGEKARTGQFFEFFEAVRRAEAEAEVTIVAAWKGHIPENWQAARDFLARRYPERWGAKETVKQEGAQQQAVTIIIQEGDKPIAFEEWLRTQEAASKNGHAA